MGALASLQAKSESRAKSASRRDSGPLSVRGERRGRQAAFSSFAGVAQRLLQIAGTLIVMPMVLLAVGSEGFGVWAVAASFFWMTVVVDFGVGQALLTSVAQHIAGGTSRQPAARSEPRCWRRSSFAWRERLSQSQSFAGSRRRERNVGVPN